MPISIIFGVFFGLAPVPAPLGYLTAIGPESWFAIVVSGKSLNKEEFVTCGGVLMRDVDLRTMESRLVRNLFFAGEVMDIDGLTGGFNFQSAWTTGRIAGEEIALRCLS